jgi:hypothetical protein
VRIAIGQNVAIKVTGIEDASGSIEPFLRLSIRRRKWDRCGLRLRTMRCCGRRFARAILNLGQTCGATVPLSAIAVRAGQIGRSDRLSEVIGGQFVVITHCTVLATPIKSGSDWRAFCGASAAPRQGDRSPVSPYGSAKRLEGSTRLLRGINLLIGLFNACFRAGIA